MPCRLSTVEVSHNAEFDMTQFLLDRLVQFFDEDETAGAFLTEDGDGGYVGAISRIAQRSAR